MSFGRLAQQIAIVLLLLALVALVAWQCFTLYPAHRATVYVVAGIIVGAIVTTAWINRDHPIDWRAAWNDLLDDGEARSAATLHAVHEDLRRAESEHAE